MAGHLLIVVYVKSRILKVKYVENLRHWKYQVLVYSPLLLFDVWKTVELRPDMKYEILILALVNLPYLVQVALKEEHDIAGCFRCFREAFPEVGAWGILGKLLVSALEKT